MRAESRQGDSRPGESRPGEVDLAELCSSLKDTFRFDRVGIFMPVVSGETRGFEDEHLVDFEELDLGSWRAAFGRGDPNALFFDPAAPQPAQRNEVISLLQSFGPKGGPQEFLRGIGLDIEVDDITRVVLCDDDVVLAWIGATRAAPLDRAELRSFQRMVPALQRRFVVDRRLRAGTVAMRGLATALDLLSAPAFIVRQGGTLDHANTLAKIALDERPAEIARVLREAIDVFENRAQPDASRENPPEVMRLAGSGERHWLVVFRGQGTEARIDFAVASWGLTARQRDVLEGIVAGDANKTIARRLHCAEATVEAHATAIYRKARVEGRSALIAKLLAF